MTNIKWTVKVWLTLILGHRHDAVMVQNIYYHKQMRKPSAGLVQMEIHRQRF